MLTNFRKPRFAVIGALIWLLAKSGFAQMPSSHPCAAKGGAASMIAAVNERGELELSDGRLGRLADLDFGFEAAPAARWADHLTALRHDLAGLPVRVDDGPGLKDRWGRHVLRLTPAGQDREAEPLHVRLVRSGLARVLPLDDDDNCARALLPVESRARAEGLGLWREPALRVLDAAEPAALRAMAGRFAIVEGRVVSVGQRAGRAWLNFGANYQRDFSVMVPDRRRALLEKAQIVASQLRGRRVRVRGIMTGQRAPQIVLVSAAQIEVVE